MKLQMGFLLLIGLVGAAPPAAAQYGGRGWRRAPPKFPDAETLRERRFIFCRVLYTSVRREWLGHGWDTDYPDADQNLTFRLGELTRVDVAHDGEDDPNHVVVELTDDALFHFPFIFMSDVGTVGFSEAEVERLRTYLLKGGFLWVDDFWGQYAWDQWEREIRRVLPDHEIIDIPTSHPMLDGIFHLEGVPQIPSIQFWRRSGGNETSERGIDSATPHLRALVDNHGRVMVLMTHNTDIADGWERENEEYEFFHRFSPDSYALAVNVVMYVLSH